jgi:hypothetical protein
MSYVCNVSIKIPRIKNIELIPKFGKGFLIYWFGNISPLLVIPQKVIPNGYVLSAAVFNGIIRHADCTLIVT